VQAGSGAGAGAGAVLNFITTGTTDQTQKQVIITS